MPSPINIPLKIVLKVEITLGKKIHEKKLELKII